MSKKYTPGPWQVIFEDTGEGHIIRMGSAIESPGHHLAIHLLEYNHGVEPGEKGFEEAEANAHLIAAAPDLLLSLETILTEVEDYEKRTGQCVNYWPNMARAAVAKAKGIGS